MMQIIVNGDPTQVADAINMTALVAHLGLTGKRIAVEVNADLVPRGSFDDRRLAPGDRVEIIHAVGGG